MFLCGLCIFTLQLCKWVYFICVQFKTIGQKSTFSMHQPFYGLAILIEIEITIMSRLILTNAFRCETIHEITQIHNPIISFSLRNESVTLLYLEAHTSRNFLFNKPMLLHFDWDSYENVSNQVFTMHGL